MTDDLFKPFNTDVSVYILIDTFLHISFYGNDEDEENLLSNQDFFHLMISFFFLTTFMFD